MAKLESLPYCQGLSLWERWHGVSRDGEGKDADEKTNDLCITVAFWPEISIIRKQPAILKIKSLAYGAAAVGKYAAAGRCLHNE